MEQVPPPHFVRKLRKIKRQPTENPTVPERPITFGTPSQEAYTQTKDTTDAEYIDTPLDLSDDAADATTNEVSSDDTSTGANQLQPINEAVPQYDDASFYSEPESGEYITNDDEFMPAAEAQTIADLVKNKTVRLLMLIACLAGAFFGYSFLPRGGISAGQGLDGVVLNPNVPSGRSRCGVADPQQGCVLYLMNPHNTEVSAKEFYTTAAKWTNRKLYMIETNNLHYGNTIIKPGYIAQINIPPL